MLPLAAAAPVQLAGNKARSLARARAAGLPTADGFVVLPDEEIDPAAIARALDALGGERFVVRSSADVEDLPGLSAAGVFASFSVGHDEVAGAVERVRASAHAQPALAYLGARGGRRVRMAVLVQPFIEGLRHGVLHTAPREPEGLRAEERRPGEPESGEVTPVRVQPEEPLGAGALALERLFGHPVDVEYARTGRGPIYFQVRPLAALQHPVAAGWDPGAPGVFLHDAEHNPEPLSAAQASLVHRLAREPLLAPQRLVHGYLYVAERRAPAAAVLDEEALLALYTGRVEPACARALAPHERGEHEASPASLEAAVEAYAEVARWTLGELGPALRAARGALDDLLQRSIGEGLSAHGALLAGTGSRTRERDAALRDYGLAAMQHKPARLLAYLDRFGAYAPVWDVASPTDDEAAARVNAAAAVLARGPSLDDRHRQALAAAEAEARRVADRFPPSLRATFETRLAAARAAQALREDDDGLFFRAQRAVRRPLRALGRALAQAGTLPSEDAIFALPIDDALRLRDGDAAALASAAGRAAEAQATFAAARALVPPAAIRDGVPHYRGGGGDVLVGAGTAGRGYGRAFLLDEARSPTEAGDARTPPPGAVLVARAILPSLTWLLPGAAGLVTDQGGALSHAATLAREYGVPAVLGTGVASRLLRHGEELIVDADGGKVYRTGAT